MSRRGRKLSLERTVFAPAWGNSITQNVAFVCWHLEQHPEILETLFELCDDHQRRRPGKGFSVKDAFGVLRWYAPVGADDDVFSIDNNLTAWYTRIYLSERPNARGLIDKRNAVADSLGIAEQTLIDAALARGRAKLEARNPPND